MQQRSLWPRVVQMHDRFRFGWGVYPEGLENRKALRKQIQSRERKMGCGSRYVVICWPCLSWYSRSSRLCASWASWESPWHSTWPPLAVAWVSFSKFSTWYELWIDVSWTLKSSPFFYHFCLHLRLFLGGLGWGTFLAYEKITQEDRNLVWNNSIGVLLPGFWVYCLWKVDCIVS